jgi:hypothetical protein
MDALIPSDARHGYGGEVAWWQCRRFEVPAAIAASPGQELQIECGTGILCSTNMPSANSTLNPERGQSARYVVG